MNRFKDNEDGTVTDNRTGLVWSKNADHGKMEWDRANHYCYRLGFAGHNDWRLPSRLELESLLDLGQYHPALSEGHPFLNVQSSLYWSSSTGAFGTNLAWGVDMYSGYVYNGSKSSNDCVWPVRSRTQKGMKDLNSEFSAAVDKHFWELI